MTSWEMREAIVARVKECIEKARTRWPDRNIPDPRVAFDVKGTKAGVAKQGIGVAFNMHIALAQPDAFLARTPAHEAAHWIQYFIAPRSKPHGHEWQYIMRFLGLSAERCHSYEVPASTRRVRHASKYNYKCACRVHQVGACRHKRMMTGTNRYRCKACGTALVPA